MFATCGKNLRFFIWRADLAKHLAQKKNNIFLTNDPQAYKKHDKLSSAQSFTGYPFNGNSSLWLKQSVF